MHHHQRFDANKGKVRDLKNGCIDRCHPGGDLESRTVRSSDNCAILRCSPMLLALQIATSVCMVWIVNMNIFVVPDEWGILLGS